MKKLLLIVPLLLVGCGDDPVYNAYKDAGYYKKCVEPYTYVQMHQVGDIWVPMTTQGCNAYAWTCPESLDPCPKIDAERIRREYEFKKKRESN